MLPARVWRSLLRKTQLAPRRPSLRRLSAEQLEDRLVPATVSWINLGSGNWDVGSNWSSGAVPGSGDTAVINTTGNATITVQSSDDIQVLAIMTGNTDTLSIDGGSLEVTSGESVLSGYLSIIDGSLTASGTAVNLTANGETTVSQGNLYASGGATLSLPMLTSYEADSTVFQAYGMNSVLNLRALSTTAEESNWYINAINGGLIDLNGLTSLPATYDVFITDNGNSTILDNNLTSLSDAIVTLDGTDANVANSWTDLTNGGLTITGGSYDLTALSDIDNTSLGVGGGGSLTLPAVTAYSALDTEIQVTDPGSILDLSNLTQITQNNLLVSAQDQGQLNLSGLTSVTGTGTFTILDYGYCTIQDGNLTSLSNASVTSDGTDQTVAEPWTTLTASSFNLTARTLTLPNLANLEGTDFVLNGALSLPGLTSTSNSNVTFDPGATLTLAGDVIDPPAPGTNGTTIEIPALPEGLSITLADSGTYAGGTTFDIAPEDAVNIASGTFSGGVNFNMGVGAIIDLTDGHSVTYSGILSGSPDGTVQIGGGVLYIGDGGITLDFTGDTFQWVGGVISALDGDLTNIGTMTLSGSATKEFANDGLLDNYGTIIQTGSGNLMLGTDGLNPTTMNNESNASYLIESDSGFTEASDSNSATGLSINNAGTICKTSGNGISILDVLGNISNAGVIEVDSGTLELYTPSLLQLSNGTLSGGTWEIQSNATLLFPGFVTNNAATIILSGPNASIGGLNDSLASNSGNFSVLNGMEFTVEGDISNSGNITIGTDSIFAVAANFTEASTGTIAVQIGSSPSDGQFGQLIVEGSAVLGGSFALTLVNGFDPTVGQQFNVVSFFSETGTFASFNGLDPYFIETLTSTAQEIVAATSPVDLAAASVTAPTTATTGQQITVNWQVSNDGNQAATGSWQDSVYLSTTSAITSTSALLGAVAHTGGLAGGDSYDASLTAAVPALPPGDYYVLVQADSLYQVPEQNRSSNILAAGTGLLAISVPALTLGTSTDGSFATDDEVQYYQVTVPAGGALVVSLQSAASTGGAALYVSQGSLPTLYDYQEAADVANVPNQTVTIPQLLTGGTYYILTHGVYGAAASAAFTLTATETVGVTVSGSSSYAGGNGGYITIEIDGTNFTSSATATLTVGSTTISASSIDFVSADQIFATFNLAGAATGNYTLAVQQGGQSVAAPAPLQVVPAVAGSLQVTLSAPNSVRAGRTGAIVISYTNTSNNDMVATVLSVSSTNANVSFTTPDDPNNYVQSVQLLAVAPDGPAGILRPGQSGQLTLTLLSNDNVPNDLIPITINQMESGQPLDLASHEADLRPSTISAAAWNVIFTNLSSELGTTTDSYEATLAQAATYLGSIGESMAAVGDVSHLWEFLVEQADALFPTSTLGSTTDASLPTPGDLSLAIDRTFNSSIAGRYSQGIFGLGWSSSWEMSLSEDNSGDVSLYLGGAQVSALLAPTSYFVRENIGYLDVDGEYGMLASSNGEFIYTNPNGIQYVFFTPGTSVSGSPGGRLSYVQDANGNRITLGYNTQDQLITLTYSNPADPSEPTEQLSLTYNAQGFNSQVADGTGDVWSYTYDAAGHLLSVTAPGNLTTTYTYDTGSNPETANALLSIISHDGSQQNFTYDTATGQLVGTSANGGADAITYTYQDAAEVTATDASGAQTINWYNDFALPARVQEPLGGVSTYLYDNNGNLISYTDGGGNTYQYTYDENGNLTQIVNPLGQTTEMTNGSLDTLTSITDADDNTTEYSYDSVGNLLSITYPDGTQQSFSYDPLGNMTDTVEQNGDPVGYEYNAQGLVTEESFADGSFQTFTHDAHGNLLSASSFDTTGALMGITTLTYNVANELLSITYPNGLSLTFTYNSAGQRTQSVDQSGYTVNYTYDDQGRLSELTDGSGNLIVQYVYNDIGELAEKLNGNGTFTTYSYDADGNLLKEINFAPGGTPYDAATSTVNSSFTYTYNDLDEQTSVTDDAGKTTTYSYDATGQLTGVGLPGGQTITYVYNAAGDRTEVIDNGTPTNYTSNDDNEITEVGSTTYTYDANGNLETMTDSSDTTTYTYNDLNELVSITNPDGSVQSFQYSPLGFMVGTSTTAGGTTTQTNYLVDPTGDGNVVAAYTGNGQLIADYTYGLGLVGQTGPSGTGYYDFDAIGNTVGITGTAGTYVDQYRYLPFGETTTISASLPNPYTFVGQLGVVQIGSNLFSMRAREYTPATGQFLSNDPTGLGGGDANLRRYVGNDPTGFIDPLGLDEVSDYDLPDYDLPNYDVSESEILFLEGALHHMHKDSPSHKYQDKSLRKAGDNIVKYIKVFDEPSYLTTQPVSSGSVQNRKPHDPNVLIGPSGFGAQGFIQTIASLPYTIDFENDGSVASQDVTVTEQMDASLDWSTFQLGSFGFGSINITVPAGLTQYQTTVSYENTDGSALSVLVDLVFNVQTGVLTLTFTSVDPLTGQVPTGVFDGFLYPESDSLLDSEGYVQYIIQPKPELSNDTTINQQASVVFDINAPISTNTATNTIDSTPPTSSVSTLPSSEPSSFVVNWSGSDPNGPDIASYTIYVSVNGGAFTPWLTDTTKPSATYTGSAENTYAFYSVATDNVGLVQPTPSAAQASTSVAGPVDPENSLLTLYASTIQLDGTMTITLQARDANGIDELTGDLSKVTFTLKYKTGALGTITAVKNKNNGTYTATFTGTADGPNTIVATVNGTVVTITDPITVSGAAFSAAKSTIALASPSLVAGGSTTVTVQVEDAKGNKETAGGLTVAFKLGSTTGARGTFGPVTDNGNGTYTVTFTGTLAGSNTITATIDGKAVTSAAAAIKVVTGPLNLGTSPISLSAAGMNAGGSVTVTFQPEDAGGNKLLLPGQTVVFGSAAGQGTFGATTYNSETGAYSATFTTTAAGSYPLTASWGGQPVTSPSPGLSVAPNTASPANSVLSVASGSVASGNGVVVTLRAVDAYGNPEATGGLKVAFSLGNKTGGQGTFSAVKDNKNGTYTATFTGTIAGSNTITATIGGSKVTEIAPAITVTPGPYSLKTSVVTLSKSSVAPGATVTVTLQTKDAAGNELSTNLLVEGIAISFMLGTASGHEGTFSSVTYAGNGEYSATFTATEAGSNTIVGVIGQSKLTSKAAGISVS